MKPNTYIYCIFTIIIVFLSSLSTNATAESEQPAVEKIEGEKPSAESPQKENQATEKPTTEKRETENLETENLETENQEEKNPAAEKSGSGQSQPAKPEAPVPSEAEKSAADAESESDSSDQNDDSQPIKPVSIPTQAEIFGSFEQWLTKQKPSDSVQNQINKLREQITTTMDEGDLLETLTAMIALANNSFQPYLQSAAFQTQIYPVDKLEFLADTLDSPPWVTEAVNLQAARCLVQIGLYDEAAKLVDNLKPEQSPCPATLLFYQGLLKYQSLDKKAALPILKRLLTIEKLPVRYQELAQRMIRDLSKLKTKSLDHISRRMGDVAGRLDTGRANDKTVEIEDGIIKDLDQKIKKLEDQLQKMQQSQSQKSTNQPRQPGQHRELPRGGGGKGDVDKKDVGSSSGWGDLPEKEREKDLQQIQENFPPHYRDIIEQYFKRMSE